MQKYLVINIKYKIVEIGLFDNSININKVDIENKNINKYLINNIDRFLKEASISLKDLEFIAVNQGPAPFTTLRSVLSTVNGFNFASQVPLIGVNGIKTLLQEYISKRPSFVDNNMVIALLNAFGQELYYAYYSNYNNIYINGCSNYLNLLKSLKLELNLDSNKNIIFIGNGSELYKQDILDIFKDKAVFDCQNFDYACLEAINDQAIQEYNNKNMQDNLMPIYLK